MISGKTLAPIPARVADLLGQMTLDEKLAQIVAIWVFDLLDSQNQLSADKMKALIANGMGQITRAAGGSVYDPRATARTINAIQHFLVTETRLGIPAIVHEECCSGYMGLGGTAFPQMIGLAGTFQPDLAQKMTDVIRQQMIAVGARHGLAPVLDVARDPRWGRVEETFGEDPLLVSQFGVAYVRGLQGQDLQHGVLATGKHFIGHSTSQAGQNCAPAHLGKRDMWDFLIPPFQAAIRDAGLQTIMNSYPELDGEVVAASKEILTDILRDQLGFKGLIVSDYEAILMIHNFHHVAPDKSTAAELALKAGIQVELPSANCFGEELKKAIADGRVEMALVDAAVSTHLQKKFELGLFETPYVNESTTMDVFETPEQRSLALEIAGKSLVLLTNDGTLPLKKEMKKIAVIGPNAADARNLLGDYSYASMLQYMHSIAAEGSPLAKIDENELALHSIHVPTVVESIHAEAPGLEITYEQGCPVMGTDTSGFEKAVNAAHSADVVILVLGDCSGLVPQCSTGETRDSADLRLPGVQNELAKAIFAVGKPTVVVLVNGRPLAIPDVVEGASAVLEAWLPGEEGGPAIAKALFGKINPGGKLAITFPRHVGQVPLFYNQKPSGGKSYWYHDYVTIDASPLFPFGYGLSYTKFEYSDFEVSTPQCRVDEMLDISLTVKNRGEVAGDEIVQLYICDEFACLPRPVKELKGFTRISLQPDESRRVTFHLPVNQLAFYDEHMKLMVEAGTVKIMVGSSSVDIHCEASVTIVGDPKSFVAERVFACPVEVR